MIRMVPAMIMICMSIIVTGNCFQNFLLVIVVDGNHNFMLHCRYYSGIANGQSTDDQNLHKHETFYCAVQTCCYIVCYHGVSLGSLIRDRESDQANWELVMTSKFQPLKFCLQSVRVEFLRLAREICMFSSVGLVFST